MSIDKSELTVYTIGAYGFNEVSFLKALKSSDIDTFCDIRLRRGMRGSEYAWANSNRLQANLKEHGINYVYVKELAPTKEIREKQKEDDLRLGINKRDRAKLGKVFTELYKEVCFDNGNIMALINILPHSAKKIALFCVEKTPEACHRSILAEHLCNKYDFIKGGDIGQWKF